MPTFATLASASLLLAPLLGLAAPPERPMARTEPDANRMGATTTRTEFCDPIPLERWPSAGEPRRGTRTNNEGSPEGRPDGGIAGEGATVTFLSLDTAPEGDMPRSVAVTPDGQYAVVVNRDTDLMVFIELNTVTIAASVPIGDYPLDIAISGDGRYAVATNAFDDTVSIVDVATKSLVATVPVSGSQPYRVLCSADGSTAVVGLINDGVASAFSIIDLDTLSEVRTFASTPQGVVGFFFTPAFAIGGELTTLFDITPDGSRILLPWRGGAQVTIYEIETGRASAALAVDASPSAVDISDDGSLAVIVHDGNPSHVTTVNLGAESVIDGFVIPTSLDPFIARLTPDNQFVMAGALNSVAFVDLATGSVATTVSTGTVGDIEVSADGQWAFVSNFNAAVIDLASRTLAKTIPFGACVDSAASPSTNVAVALNNRFREEVYAFNLAGAASNLRGWTRSGPAPEADAPKEIALSPDGTKALVANSVSRNVSLIDLATETILATIDTGDVPRESAFTPDGAYALVCNGDANTLSIIDVASATVVKTLNTPQRPIRVRVAPDGSKAYVVTVAGTDALYVITLAGANSSILTSFPIGQLGAANGYPYSEVSGMELSPDGKWLAVTISFDDILRVVSTATNTVVANAPTGDFPIRALFSPDSSRLFVANAFGDSVQEIDVADGAFIPLGTTGGIDFPLDMALDADGQHLYVGRSSFQSPAIDVVELASASVVASIPLPGLPREGEYLADRDEYLVTTDDGSLVRIAAAGADSAVLEIIPISGSAPDFRFSAALNLGIASWPGVPDGVDIIRFGGAPLFGDLDGDGSVGASDLALILGAWGSTGGPADLDGDGSVGAPDIALLLGAWTPI
jgi:YVTN family beta-propeller protein